MGAITQLCNRVIWLEDGHIQQSGPSATVVSAYLSKGTNRSTWINPATDGVGKEMMITSARTLSLADEMLSVIPFSAGFRIEIRYSVFQTIRDLTIISGLKDAFGNAVWTSWDSDVQGWRCTSTTEPGEYRTVCNVPGHLLRPGNYKVWIGARSLKRNFDAHEALGFDISDVGYKLNHGRQGILTPVLNWQTWKLSERNLCRRRDCR
jgi:hypothetical protein